MGGNLIKQELAKEGAVSIVKVVTFMIEEAHIMRASDIHIDPQNGAIRVRYRIDGVLNDLYRLPTRLLPEIISRIKILSGLRTDEHQSPQDGRFRVVAGGMPLDIRVSVTPTYYGENSVLRLLSDKAETFTLESLGFSGENAQKVKNAVRKPYGMILSTGPTGSGKTTTLYTLLKTINTSDVSIITIEDPVEYAVDGLQQTQVNSRTGLTFANGLRSILRQDPNIIMVGEIRDPETSGIAVNAALTGHLVLSTLHTNDAATTLPRLLDMGTEGYLIASTINAVIAQRLVRKICLNCKSERKITEAELKSLKNVVKSDILENASNFYFGKGCEKCGNTGYHGRVGIYEVLIPDDVIREAVLSRETSGKLKEIAAVRGMKTIIEDGFLKAASGITTVEEILRTVYE